MSVSWNESFQRKLFSSLSLPLPEFICVTGTERERKMILYTAGKET